MQRFKNVLVVLNDDGMSDAVFARAKWLADSNGASLTLLTVKKSVAAELDWLVSRLPGQNRQDLDDRLDAALQDDMEEAAKRLRADRAEVRTEMAEGTGFIETIRMVLRNDHDLVLKGVEQSFDWRTFGGPDLHLLRKCPCPVWILNSSAEPSARRIMAAVDPDPEDPLRDALNQKVMQLATSLANQDHASLDVLNAWYFYEEHLLRGRRGRMPSEQVDAMVEETRHKSRWRLDQLTADYASTVPDINVLHIKGLPQDVIVHHAEQQRIDTLVMGTLGREGLPGLFIGNTAETVLNRVQCSVLAIKPEGFISPVKL